VQDSVNESIQALTRIPILESNLVTGVALTTAATAVEHGLGRKPLGFIVVDNTVDCRVWRSPTESLSPNSTIMLLASAITTVSLLVF